MGSTVTMDYLKEMDLNWRPLGAANLNSIMAAKMITFYLYPPFVVCGTKIQMSTLMTSISGNILETQEFLSKGRHTGYQLAAAFILCFASPIL